MEVDNYKDIYKDIHNTVWGFRNRYDLYWKTPTKEDCVKYAFCECGELMDATLRIDRKDDARNNTKIVDIEGELADIVIMLVSSNDNFNDETPNVDVGHLRNNNKLIELCYNVANYMAVLSISNSNKPYQNVTSKLWSYIAFRSCIDYAHELHIDLLQQVILRLERIKQKHVKGL